MNTPVTEHGWSGKHRIVLGGAAVMLVALLVVALIVGATRDRARFEAGTPEATVQAFLRAVVDNRRQDATEQLTEEFRERCPASRSGQYYPRISRVVLVNAFAEGDEATVEVAITESFGAGLFDTNESTVNATLVLARTAEGWRISEAPWPFYDCLVRVGP